MKKKIALALAMIMAAVSLTACGGGGTASASAASGGAAASGDAETEVWTIGFANRDDSDVYLKAVQVAFKELVDADPTLEGLYADGATDSQLQLDQIDNFFVQGIDALVLVPQDIRCSVGSGGNCVSEKGLAGAAQNPLRDGVELWRLGTGDRKSQSRESRRRRQS